MKAFQKTTLLIAGGILIIYMIGMAYILYYASANETWPPTIGECPDYWALDCSDGPDKCICKNPRELGTCQTKQMNFNLNSFTGSQGLCNKYKWAQKCDIAWDGLTYGVESPCDS